MKQLFSVILIFMSAFMTSSQTKITLTVENCTATATLADNAATRALLSMLDEGPVTISMSDYGGFEKVGPLPQALPSSDSYITTSAGDIMLYDDDNIVIFYGSNSWSYTPLGRIDGATATNVKNFLGTGSIKLTLSLPAEASIEEINSNLSAGELQVYDLNGNELTARPLLPGIYIINGIKTLIR